MSNACGQVFLSCALKGSVVAFNITCLTEQNLILIFLFKRT